MSVTYIGGPIFDGETLRLGLAVRMDQGRVTWLGPDAEAQGDIEDLGGAILSPGFVDLQVNGGGGVNFNDDPSVATLRRIAEAHRSLGTTHLLPTLISSEPEVTTAAIAAVTEAIAQGVPGIVGLHLEGPHIARPGAHDPAVLRDMTDADVTELEAAARALPVLMLTVAPERVTPDQIARLTRAGAVVSLGHTDATFEACTTAIDAGARAATHLFNAMSQMTARAPGLVGAVLADSRVSAGLIADGHHVHPAALQIALAAKAGSDGIFLVTDAMATAASDIDGFALAGRRVIRADGRLTLEDGTLAGADLEMTGALRLLTRDLGVETVAALRLATSVPARVGGLDAGRIVPGKAARLVRIAPDFSSVTPL